MNISLYNALNNMSAISNLSQTYGTTNALKTVNNYGSMSNFNGILKEQRINNVKKEIYQKFQISVGSSNGEFECYIPSDVLYGMSTNSKLKEKVYNTLEDYSGEKFKQSIQGLNPPVKKCTLIFDESGDVTATLEAKVESETSNSKSSYINTLFGQSSRILYPYTMLSGSNSMYGMGNWQNMLYMNMLGSMYSSVGRR